MPLPSINLIVLRSPDIDKARAFYSALGIAFELERHGKGPEHLAGQLGGVVLEIYPATGTADASTRIGFLVDAIDDTIANATAAGGSLVTAPAVTAWGKRAVLADPDGRRVELIQR